MEENHVKSFKKTTRNPCGCS